MKKKKFLYCAAPPGLSKVSTPQHKIWYQDALFHSTGFKSYNMLSVLFNLFIYFFYIARQAQVKVLFELIVFFKFLSSIGCRLGNVYLFGSLQPASNVQLLQPTVCEALGNIGYTSTYKPYTQI